MPILIDYKVKLQDLFSIAISLIIFGYSPCAYSIPPGQQAITTANILKCGGTSSTKILSDPDRFIAHAGGAYQGHIYTNSLEALDAAYNKGFKLFELDLIKTSDNRVVAAHDWKHWKKITGSQLEHPNLTEFLNTPVHKQLTAMDFTSINSWFSDHSDALFFTDKTKDFKFLADNFVDMDRLIVEVFSIDDFKKAKLFGIPYPMISWGTVINKEKAKGKDYLEKALRYIASDNTKFIAIHSKLVPKYGKLLNELTKKRKCIYAFSSNEDSFITKNTNKFIHGVYTDLWNLKTGKAECDVRECETY